jgi:hypothetical protein
MADRPIIFSAPMVRSLLEDRKTQTRRVLTPQPDDLYEGQIPKQLRIAIGDRLWVREAWRPDPNGREADGTISVFYPADYVKRTLYPDYGWKLPKQAQNGKVTPLHMPRWASRMTLTVTEVRVQRLQEIDHLDAEQEGVKCDMSPRTFVDHFRILWESIHGPGSWEANPWVAAISFAVEQQNIDAVKK